jgi:hypothetical protein
MNKPSNVLVSAPSRGVSLLAVIAVVMGVYGLAIYANLSFAVTKRADLRFFPPFERGVDMNMNRHLGAEYYCIAEALWHGRGFADPFQEKTGPTAWMPPVLPALLAGLLWVCDGNKDAVMAVVVFLQVSVLVITGIIMLALTRQTTGRWGIVIALVIFFGGLICNFHGCFQFTHDCWLVLLALDLLIAGLCWFVPFANTTKAVAWGVCGGFCALVNPVVALAWGVSAIAIGLRARAWMRLAVMIAVAGLTVLPWTVRNFVVFGRLIPVKSNLAYELYQSQCLQPDGLIQGSTFSSHPYGNAGRERQEYKQVGEMAFLDHKRQQFWQACSADPLDFFERAAERFFAATLWYQPYDRSEAMKRPWVFWATRVTHPLPFVAVLILVYSAVWRPLAWPQWVGIGVYLLYLLPYAVISYYDRYAIPLVGVKVLLVIWGVDRAISFFTRAESSPVRTTHVPHESEAESVERAPAAVS